MPTECYATLVDPLMNASGDDSDDKAMADPVELEIAGEPRSHRPTLARFDEAQGVVARGTRERPLTPDPGVAEVVAEVRLRRTREFDCERDPAEVLRMWPHSSSALDEQAAPTAAESPVPASKDRVENKIVLAHLALDLYREIEDLQLEASGTQPTQARAAATCHDQGCQARIDTLRGALIEACLLVQRIAMMTPAVKDEVEGRVRELLQLIEP